MRKRILCIGVLSALLVGMLSASAWATDYYRLNTITAPATITAPRYTDEYDIGTIKLSADYSYQSATSLPSGYNTANKITYALSFNPESMVATGKTLTKPSDTSIAKKNDKVAVNLVGKVVASGTVTITATQKPSTVNATSGPEITKTATIKITIPEKTAPVVSGDPTIYSVYSYDKALVTTNGLNVVNLGNYPESIDIDLGGEKKSFYDGKTGTVSKYGITATLDAYTKGKDRKITLSGTPTEPVDSFKLTIVAQNKKANGKYNKLTKSYTLSIFKPAPVVSNDTQADQPSIASRDYVVGLPLAAGNFAQKNYTNIVNFGNYPESIDVTFGVDSSGKPQTIQAYDGTSKTITYNGITATIDAYNKNNRKITLSGTPTAPADKVDLKITVKSRKAGGKWNTLNKNYVLKLYKHEPVFSGDVGIIPLGTIATAQPKTNNKDFTFTLGYYPESIDITMGNKTVTAGLAALSATALENGITVAATLLTNTNGVAAPKATRDVTIAGTPTAATDGTDIVVTVKSRAAGGKIASVSKTFTLYVKAKPVADKTGTTVNFTANGAAYGNAALPKNLGEKIRLVHTGANAEKALDTTALTTATASKPIIEQDRPLIKAQTDVLKFNLTGATLPVTITATGLPKGLEISQDAGLDASKNASGVGTATAYIRGTPQESGSFDIKLILTNDLSKVQSVDKDGKATSVAADIAGWKLSSTTISYDYKLEVIPAPSFDIKKLPDLTWSQDYSLTSKDIKATGAVASTGRTLRFTLSNTKKVKEGSAWKDQTVLPPAVLKVDRLTGKITGKLTSMDYDTPAVFSFDAKAKLEKSVIITVSNDLRAVSREVSIDILAVAPDFADKGNIQKNLNALKLKYSDDVSFKISATKVPGTISWDIDSSKLPAGLKVLISGEKADATGKKADSGTAETVSKTYITLKGKPKVALKNYRLPIKMGNAVGSVDLSLVFNVGDGGSLTVIGRKMARGEKALHTYKVDKSGNASGRAVKLELTSRDTDRVRGTDIVSTDLDNYFWVEPGPIKWSISGQPSGVRIVTDSSLESFDTLAHIEGELKSATKRDKETGKTWYTVTAKNTVTNTVKEFSTDLTVFADPQITTKTLAPLTTDKNYSGTIVGSGGESADLSWTITVVTSGDVNDTRSPNNRTAKPASLPSPKGNKAITQATYTSPVSGATSTLTFKRDAKTGNILITGSLDAMPSTDVNLDTVRVWVRLSNDYTGVAVSRDIALLVKGIAPKITTNQADATKNADFEIGTAGSFPVAATGTKPIVFGAYIDTAAAKTYFGLDGKTSIDLCFPTGSAPDNYPDGLGLRFNSNDARLEYTTDGKLALSQLPITFAARNAAVKKPVTRSLKVNIKGRGVKIYEDNDEGTTVVSPDITIFGVAGTEGDPFIKLIVSGDGPFSYTLSPKDLDNKGNQIVKNGLSITSEDEDGKKVFKISGTPTAGQETKTPFAITVVNPSTKAKASAKITIVGALPPEINVKKDKDGTEQPFEKVVEIGKTLSLKLSTKKGSKRAVVKNTAKTTQVSVWKWDTKDIGYAPIRWLIDDEAGDPYKTAADLVALGLSFDSETGTFKGTPKMVTSADDTDAKYKYEPYTFSVKASNDAGITEGVDVIIGVKGAKPRITTKLIVFNKGDADNSDPFFISSPDKMLKTNILSDDTTANVRWAWGSGADPSAVGLDDEIKGVGISDNFGNYGLLANSGIAAADATKGKSLKVSADNMGTVVTSNIRIGINDAKPEIQGEATLDATVTSEIQRLPVTYTIKTESTMATGDTKLKWTLSKKPTGGIISATIKAATDGKSATVTYTVPKNALVSTDEAKTDTVQVVVTNTYTKEYGSFDVKITINPPSTALPAAKDALPEDRLDADDEALSDDLEAEEGAVTYGGARTIEALTADQRRVLAEGGYIIAAILPEIRAEESGQYDLEAVSLDEAAPEGYELVWFAFPVDVESSDDDLIAEFYDEAGAEVFAVPEGRVVVPSPWLEAEITYAPVIAVKAPAAGDAKDSLENAEEGDTVTEKALEEAGEKPADEDEAPVIELTAEDKSE